MPSEPMATMRSASLKGIGCSPELARGVAAHGLDDVVDHRLVLRPVDGEGRLLVAGPDDDVGRRLDLLDLVAVAGLLVAREVQDLAAGLAEGLADREQHGVAQAAARQHHGLARLDLGRRAGRAHDDHRLAGLEQGAEVRRAAHLQGDQRQQALVLVDPGAGQRQALHGEQACRRPSSTAPRSSAGDRTGRARSCAPRPAPRPRPRRWSASGDRRARPWRATGRWPGPGSRRASAWTPAASPWCASAPDSPAWRRPSPSRHCRRRTDAGRRRTT